MKLIKLEAHGFKSFADPIVLRFDGGVVGIVGPNGSGKSNINDAIRWVLGEQSSKELRGDSMADVIFAGSKTSEPMNKAQVTLTFDNKERLSSIDSDTVSISRVIERDKGINEYFINGQKARLKEIKILAMETGIGKSSLAIISQGTVSDIAQSSDEQRRLIFEEAAGVSKYKFRKTESLKKLEQATQNLKIMEAKLAEMQKRLTALETQASKAYKYKELSKELSDLEIPYLVQQIEQNQTIYQELSKELEGFEETVSSYNEDLKLLENENFEKSKLLKDLKAEIANYSNQKQVLQTKISSLETSITEALAKRKLLAEGALQTNAAEQAAALVSQVKSLELELVSFKSSYDQTFSLKTELEQKINEQTLLINELNLTYKAKETKNNELKAELNHLKNMQKSKNNLYQGVKTILDNKAFFKGLKGMVSDLIKVPSEYTLAFETILKQAMQHLVVDNSQTAIKAIDFLKKNNGGRATFIPLASIEAKEVQEHYLFALRNHQGFVEVASNLAIVQEQFKVLNQFLLGNIIVARDISFATEISNIVQKKYTIVSMQGDLVRPGGILVGGSQQASENLLNLDDKITSLQELVTGNKVINQKLTQDLKVHNDTLRKYQNNLQMQITNLNALQYQINEKQKIIDKHKTSLSINDLNNVNDQSYDALNQTQSEILKLKYELSQIEYNLQVSMQENNSIETDLAVNNKKINELNNLLKKLYSSFSQKNANLTLAKNQLEADTLRLHEHYDMTFEYAKANFNKLSFAFEEAKETIENLKSQIKTLGNVNLDSIQEFEELNDRYKIDLANKEEVTQAKNLCLEAISELDKKIIQRLTSIVDDVNEQMHNVFSSLFGGGTAKVRFLDPNNILESGISIYAQPPGKKVKNLKLFSGGEKALIAISLLFAILRARPLPLCILDEVEAALDESNVVRYAEYLQELKHKTQFLVITHRTGTMTRVDALFGATMQKRGVTSFFSVELAEAKKLIQE